MGIVYMATVNSSFEMVGQAGVRKLFSSER